MNFQVFMKMLMKTNVKVAMNIVLNVMEKPNMTAKNVMV